MIIGIACVQDKTWCIGDNSGNGNLLYHIGCDLELFKKKTLNHICVMGYGCFKSLPKQQPLPKRLNIVLCTKEDAKNLPAGVIAYTDFTKLLNDILSWSKNGLDIYICGGGMFYKSRLPYYDLLYITKVYDTEKTGNVYFPDLDKDSDFEIDSHLSLKGVYTKEKYLVDFLVYKTINKGV